MISSRSIQPECGCISECPRNFYEMNNESLVFQQNDLFPLAFPCMEEIRRQGKLCDVVLKVSTLKHCNQISGKHVFTDRRPGV